MSRLGTQRQFVQYHQRVLELEPIAYWLGDEKQGTVAYDWVAENGARNGTYVGVTLGQPGIGDGRTTPYFDGLNDYTNVLTPSLAAAYSAAECTVGIALRVNPGAWTDGAHRTAVFLYDDANNHVYMRKQNFNNQFSWWGKGGAVTQNMSKAGITDQGWILASLTRSESANQFIAYWNGVQEGAIQVGLGAWAGPIAFAIIGASSLVPANPWHGWLGHCFLLDYALPADGHHALYNAFTSH